MGFIPAVKIDKVVVGEGVVMKGEITCGESGALTRFMKAFYGFLNDWRDRASKLQTEIDFTSGVTIPGVKLRADKPKLKAKEYSIGIDMTNVSMEDRSKLYAMSQDDSKVLHISITTEALHKFGSDTQEAANQTLAVKIADATDSPGLVLVNHSVGKLDLPTFPIDTLEERLQVALLLRADSAERWAGRIKAGLTDRDLKKAITSEWAGELYEAPDGGKHFIVQGGNAPKFRLAANAGVRANITSTPDLQGAKLLSKVREVLGLEDPVKKKAAKTA